MKVYQYGLLPPITNAQLVRDQMRGAHRYRNLLVEIARGERQAVRDVIGARVQARELLAVAAQKKLTDALGIVKTSRAKDRRRSETADQRATIRQARLELSDARKALRAARHEQRSNPDVVKALDDIHARGGDLRRGARALCGVHWGSYLLIEDADTAARKMPLYDGTEPNDPRFVRWEGDGAVAVQLQGGLAVPLLKTDTQLQIVGADPIYKTLRMRVGSEPNREPIWAEWPVKLHRPLPEDGIVKRAAVHVHRRGPKDVWTCEITVEEPEQKHIERPGTVAIDVGWRLMNDRLRVACFRATDGRTGEIALDTRTLQRFGKVRDLVAIRKKNLNGALMGLAWWISFQAAPPEWLPRPTDVLMWRSPGRLARLVAEWKPFDAGSDLLDRLKAFLKQDRHLWEWESNQRARTLRHRREVYRLIAHDLSTHYGELVLEEFDLRKLARTRNTEDDADNDTARRHRQMAAVSELRNILTTAFKGRGGIVSLVPAEHTTKTCHVCGSVEEFDAAIAVTHVCSACGQAWDQDDNAAIVMLARRDRLRAAEKTAPARSENEGKSEGRWTKARRLATEKKVRREGAREPDAKST